MTDPWVGHFRWIEQILLLDTNRTAFFYYSFAVIEAVRFEAENLRFSNPDEALADIALSR